MLLLICYNYDQYNIILIIYFVITIHQMVAMLILRYTRVGNEVIEGIVGQHGVPGRNEGGERLLEMCADHAGVRGG